MSHTASSPTHEEKRHAPQVADGPTWDDDARLGSFAEAIDGIRARVEAEFGEEDLAYFRRVDRFSRGIELAGRALIHFSLDPVSFSLGVGALWVHKQLQTFEIGHTALHGVFDRFPGAKRYHSKNFYWDLPVDEPTWIRTHFGHHAHPNVPGMDDIFHFATVRFHEDTPRRWYHRFQPLYLLLAITPTFGFSTNVHVTGLNDYFFGHEGHFDFISERSPSTLRRCATLALRKFVPYYAKNYLFYPALAGPFFPKVLAGNFLAELLRSLWMGATVMSNHSVDTAVRPPGWRPRSRGEALAMQVEATHDFAVSLPVSMLCGALDCHIEHHLFPRLPPKRLREIRAEVQAVCEAHGVRYRRVAWPTLLRRVFEQAVKMAREDDGSTVRRPLRHAVAEA